MNPASLKILQVGLGGFGQNHLRAWHQLGLSRHLFVADLSEDRRKAAEEFNVASTHATDDYRSVLADVDIVDIVTPTDSHFDICRDALLAGKDVFIEKPLTLTAHQARELASIVAKAERVLMIGYYYRYHPISQLLKSMVDEGALGELQYLSGEFMGFKRARTDVGVMHTDGIHFLDLFTWFLSEHPQSAYAVTRDHFDRSLEDFAIALVEYPSGAVAKVESGYIQPGEWRDKVVPGAFTTKRIFVVGRQAVAEADFETERLVIHDVQHEPRLGTWWPRYGGASSPAVASASPIDMIKLELTAFFECVEARRVPPANVWDSGVVLAELMETIYDSAARGERLPLPPLGERQIGMP